MERGGLGRGRRAFLNRCYYIFLKDIHFNMDCGSLSATGEAHHFTVFELHGRGRRLWCQTATRHLPTDSHLLPDGNTERNASSCPPHLDTVSIVCGDVCAVSQFRGQPPSRRRLPTIEARVARRRRALHRSLSRLWIPNTHVRWLPRYATTSVVLCLMMKLLQPIETNFGCLGR